jgi:hypothetical protein
LLDHTTETDCQYKKIRLPSKPYGISISFSRCYSLRNKTKYRSLNVLNSRDATPLKWTGIYRDNLCPGSWTNRQAVGGSQTLRIFEDVYIYAYDKVVAPQEEAPKSKEERAEENFDAGDSRALENSAAFLKFISEASHRFPSKKHQILWMGSSFET